MPVNQERPTRASRDAIERPVIPVVKPAFATPLDLLQVPFNYLLLKN